jgi:hypothetical protein
MPEPQYDEHGHLIVAPEDQLDVDPVGDPDHYGSAGDPAMAERIRAMREGMLADPGPVLDLSVPR